MRAFLQKPHSSLEGSLEMAWTGLILIAVVVVPLMLELAAPFALGLSCSILLELAASFVLELGGTVALELAASLALGPGGTTAMELGGTVALGLTSSFVSESPASLVSPEEEVDKDVEEESVAGVMVMTGSPGGEISKSKSAA